MMYALGNKLNRSCSDSELFNANFDNSFEQSHYGGFEKKVPLVRKRFLFVEKIIQGDSPRILRSGSCCEVIGCSTPDHLHNLENLFAAGVVLNNTPSISNNIHKSYMKIQSNLKIPESSSTYINSDDIVPMEVDVPSNLHNLKTEDCVDFIETMDIDPDTENYINDRVSSLENMLKKRSLSKRLIQTSNFLQRTLGEKEAIENKTEIIPITQLEKKKSHNRIYVLVLVAFVLVLLLYISFSNYHLSVNSEIQLQHIQQDLFEKVYGQKTSVDIVVRSLQQRERWKSKIKVLSFIGSTGVGKTFIANLIKKHFHRELIHELYGVQLSYKSQWDKILNGLKSCCLNLIIVDDLKNKDATDLFALIHSLPRNQFIFIISIFNIQYSNDKLNYTINYGDIIQIRNEFDNSGLYHEVIIFEEFSTDQVKDWIEKQLNLQNIDFSLQQRVVKNILEGHKAKYQGLKGLQSKMLLLLEKYNH